MRPLSRWPNDLASECHRLFLGGPPLMRKDGTRKARKPKPGRLHQRQELSRVDRTYDVHVARISSDTGSHGPIVPMLSMAAVVARERYVQAPGVRLCAHYLNDWRQYLPQPVPAIVGLALALVVVRPF